MTLPVNQLTCRGISTGNLNAIQTCNKILNQNIIILTLGLASGVNNLTNTMISFQIDNLTNYQSTLPQGPFSFTSSESNTNYLIHQTLNGGYVTNTQTSTLKNFSGTSTNYALNE
jgi:hypothetical protein